MNKKIIMVFLFVAVLISIFSAPFSAFANSNNHIEGKPNQYGVVPYNDKMIIKYRDIYSNDYSNPEYIKAQKEAGFANYDGKFDAKKHLGGILCSDMPNANYSENTKNLAKKACESWKNQKNNILLYNRYNNDTYYSYSKFIFYTGKKDIKLKYAKISNSDNFEYNGFFADLAESDYNDFYVVFARIGQPYYECANKPKVGKCSAEFIDVSISFDDFTPEQYPYKKPFDNYKFIFGRAYDSYVIPVFSTFGIEYPEDYPDEDKIATNNRDKETPPRRETFHPYFWFSVKNKNMKGMIQSFFDSGKNIGSDGATGRIKPFFELYDSKKENKIFEYNGTTLADNFKYDFEKFGTYYVKTFVSWDFPAPLAPSARPEIIQPIWTKVIINGSNYAFMNNPNGSDKACDSNNNCSPPDYVESCSLIKDDVSLRFACEVYRLDSKFRQRFGILMLPLDITSHTIQNFQTKTNISCSISNGQLKVDACVFERKLPALYTFLNMVANGVIIFAFVLFLRNSLVGFLNSKGDE